MTSRIRLETPRPVEPRADGLLELQVVRCDGPA
jgi:hypothetical protein